MCMHLCRYSLYAITFARIVCFVSSADVALIYMYAEVFREVEDLLYLSSAMLYKKSFPGHIHGANPS